MSIKLGSSLLAGNLDKNMYPSKDEMNELFSSSVKLDGDQDIYGNKVYHDQVEFRSGGAVWSTATGTQRDSRYKCKFYQYGLADNVLPSNSIFGGIHCWDKNQFEYGTIYSEMRPDGSVSSNLWVHTPNGNSVALGITQRSDGVTTTHAPHPPTSDNSSQIATTSWVNNRLGGTNITSTELGYLDGVTSAIQTQLNNRITASVSKAENGYIKFSNGIIIQWGKFTDSGNTVVTFPTAFTTTNYSLGFSYESIFSNTANVKDMCYTDKKTTGFKSHDMTRNIVKNYMAIGY